MGRGKIEIKRIENDTNRQVTYSKRRNGIFKKARELTVLCDAKVSLIMFSGTGKLHEFISPSTSTKKIFDQYQKTLGIDLWSSHYEKMQENLRKLREVNNKLRREIRQRMGEDLEYLSIDELRSLEAKMDASVAAIRDRKYHTIKTQTDTCRKKVKNLEQRHGNLLLHFIYTRYFGFAFYTFRICCNLRSYAFGRFHCIIPNAINRKEAKCEDPQYGIVDNEGDYESTVALANGATNLYALGLHHGHHPDLHHGGGFGSQLRLA